MATKAPPYPKQKYTDTKFREIVPLLPLAESLKIEYLIKGVWYKMVSKRGNSHNCECCCVENLGPTPIVDHLRGKKHRSALQNNEKLFHPNYTFPKNPNTPARTPILDVINANAGAANVPKTGKAIPTKLTTPVQKPVGQQKQGAVEQTKQPQQKAPVKKVAANSEAPKGTDVDKPGESQAGAKPAGANSAPDQSNESKPPVQNQNKPAPKAPQQQTQIKAPQSQGQPATEDVKEAKVSQQPATANSNANSDKKEPKKEDDDEVIIINDDVEDVKKTPQNVDTEQNVITVINSVPPKPQRPQKNAPKPTPAPQTQQNIPTISTQPKSTPATTKKNETTTPAQSKKVINPAAILAKTAESSDANEPQYEQNRVIIPTIDKIRKRQPIEAPAPKKAEQPSFSTKTFTTAVNDNVDGIIGVEYVVKILKVYNDPEPFYECCLCEVVMDGIGMQTHLLGYNHRYKYVEKHFPTCFNQYKEHIGNIQVMGIILDRVAKAIETHHGRELPYECLSGEFRSNRHGVMTTVYSFRHASEYSGPSFTNVVDANQVEEFYKKKNVYLPPKPDPKRKPTFDTRSTGPSPKRNRVEPPVNIRGGKRGGSRGNAGPPRRPYREEEETNPVDDAVHKQMVEEFLQNTCDRARSPGGHRRRHKSRSRSRSPHRTLHKRQRRSPSPLREGDIWQAYRHLVDRSKVEVDEMYREYRRDPEKHPLYDEEWRKFWKHRKDEMTREGLDYRNYDFQPEWVRFFAVRIEELYDEALENIKINSRQRLILPMTNDELEDKKYHIKVPEYEQQETLKTKNIPSNHQEAEKKMSVVHVLRLLTALEDYLGSLGPRVVDLLSKALLVEKSNPRDVNEIVLTLENCTVLETAMEKLKGVLIAGLLEGPKVRAFNNVISATEKILRNAFKFRELNPQTVPQPVPAPKSAFESQSQKQPFSGGSAPQSHHQSASMGNGNSGAAANLLSQIDKKELAAKLAAALTAQGKTDFNPEQLQQLIAVYSLIDKKKRDSAAADKQKMTLSDTLTALLNPKDSNVGGGMSGSSNPSSGRNVGSYSSNSNSDRPGAVTNSSINNFVSMLNRDSLSAGGSATSGDSQMWQNLQNIQTSLRMQNTAAGAGKAGGYNSSSSLGDGGREGRGGYMGDMSSGSNFTRSGFGASGSGSGTGGSTGMERGGFSLAQNSSLNFTRGGGGGTGSGNAGGSKDGSGFYGNFQGMSSSFSRSGDSMADSGRGSFGGSGRNFTGDNNYPRGGGGTGLSGGNSGGGGNGSRYSGATSDSFLGMSQSGGNTGSGGNGFSSGFNSGGFSSSSGGFGSSSYQRGSGGGGLGSSSGLGFGSGSGLGMNTGTSSGSSFSRGGGGSSGFGSLMNNNSNFSSNSGRNESSGGQQFGSNSRGMSGGNQGNPSMGRNQLGGGNMGNSSNSQGSSGNRGGSNWRNQ